MDRGEEFNQLRLQLELPLETFHEFEDAYEARWTVVRMYHEGWKKKSIIQACYIEKQQAWQNLIESQFKIQLRLADAKFEQATSLEEIQAQHAAFIQIFNTTNHWAHRERQDGARTPVAVLAWQQGRS